MLKDCIRQSLVIFICHAIAYTPLLNAGQLALPPSDLIAPEIIQENYEDTLTAGEDYTIIVTVTDNVSVKQVVLYYRTINTENYKSRSMQNIAGTDDYTVTISAEQIQSPCIEYYIQAIDTPGNSLLHGYSFSPLSAKLVDDVAAVVATTDATSSLEDEEKSTSKWLWIGLGVLAVGAVAAAASGGGDDGGGASTATGDVTVTW